MGLEVGLVVGGGNIWRGRSGEGMYRTTADHMGMLAIYVGKMDMFHKQFKLNSKPVEITPNDWTPDWLGEDDLQLKNRKAYEIILKYVS